MAEQATLSPTRKVVAGGIAGSATIVLVWLVNATLLKSNPMPAEVASALTTVVSAIVSYFVRPAPGDLLK